LSPAVSTATIQLLKVVVTNLVFQLCHLSGDEHALPVFGPGFIDQKLQRHIVVVSLGSTLSTLTLSHCQRPTPERKNRTVVQLHIPPQQFKPIRCTLEDLDGSQCSSH